MLLSPDNFKARPEDAPEPQTETQQAYGLGQTGLVVQVIVCQKAFLAAKLFPKIHNDTIRLNQYPGAPEELFSSLTLSNIIEC